MHLVGYLYEDYHDARSLEHKVGSNSVSVLRTKHHLPDMSCIVFRNPILNSTKVAYVRSSHGEVREYET